MSTPEIVVRPDAATLAESIAARLVARIAEVQSGRPTASLCLTGGTIGIALLAAVAKSPARDAVDWSRLDLWWGDERYLPADNPERNVEQARTALLDGVPLDPARVHPMAAAGTYASVEDAAAAYARELAGAAHAQQLATSPSFDVCLLGIGPEGHVASLFPGEPALHDDRAVVAVHGSPKPPPTRITLTMATLCGSQEVWIVASGDTKAGAVRLALSEEVGVLQVPAAGARGLERTVFLLDEAAAADLPHDLRRIASP
ncbi:MAG: 6-phosphogluconolactonase [Candidatus Nanopelagicales bacterium]